MAPVVTDTPAPVPPSLLAPLQAHLPYSFAVLRRAQFTHHPQGTTPHAHFLFASDPDEEAPSSSSPPRDGGDPGPGPGPRHFAAAYLDLSQHPETQMYLYSTLQDAGDDTPADTSAELEDRALDLIMALLAHVRHVAAATAAEARHPLPEGDRGRGLMVGGLHERTYRLLVARRGVASSYWNPHDVWLFRVEDLPPAPPPSTSSFLLPGPRDHHQQQQQQQEEEDLRWDVVREDDVPLIASRTKIPKVARTLMSEPSVAVRDGEALVAWGFIGTAGTLSTLHVEEPYRGRGIAKAIATKVMRDHSFGDDGWGSADVHVDNVQSQGLCKSLGAKKGLRTCWTVLTFDSMPSLEKAT